MWSVGPDATPGILRRRRSCKAVPRRRARLRFAWTTRVGRYGQRVSRYAQQPVRPSASLLFLQLKLVHKVYSASSSYSTTNTAFLPNPTPPSCATWPNASTPRTASTSPSKLSLQSSKDATPPSPDPASKNSKSRSLTWFQHVCRLYLRAHMTMWVWRQ